MRERDRKGCWKKRILSKQQRKERRDDEKDIAKKYSFKRKYMKQTKSKKNLKYGMIWKLQKTMF